MSSSTESESYVTTDGRPASLSWNKAPIWGLRPDLYYCLTVAGFVDLGRPLWREDGSFVYSCCWPSPTQSFSGPGPVGLVAISYCLRFETSLFVACYDSQGHGGGIRPRLHTGSWSTTLFCTTYIFSKWTHRKHVHCLAMEAYCCPERASTGPLPNNECPPITESSCRGNAFTEPLPSNGHMRHNISLTTRIEKIMVA
jgi:hypothetical protein